MTRFGNIFSADQLEDAVVAFLQKWFRTYAAEVSQQRVGERDAFAEPRWWGTTPAMTADVVDQIRYPAVLVVSNGVSGRPTKRGDGKYEAPYMVGVMILTTGRNEDAANRLARRYGAAVRTAILQKKSLGTNFILGTEWADERFTDYVRGDQEAAASVVEIFNFTVGDIGNAQSGLGPLQPDPLPEPATYGELPTVKDPSGPGGYDPTTVTQK